MKDYLTVRVNDNLKKRVTVADLTHRNGLYRGVWSGYVVSFKTEENGPIFELQVPLGNRGKTDCEVIVAGDEITINPI